jgi:hypothetical protein
LLLLLLLLSGALDDDVLSGRLRCLFVAFSTLASTAWCTAAPRESC